MSYVSFSITEGEADLIRQIVDRAVRMQYDVDRQQLEMDLTACHANGCRLDLDKLLNSPDFDFAHDVFGIRRWLDRSTGTLPVEKFEPRCRFRSVYRSRATRKAS